MAAWLIGVHLLRQRAERQHPSQLATPRVRLCALRPRVIAPQNAIIHDGIFKISTLRAQPCAPRGQVRARVRRIRLTDHLNVSGASAMSTPCDSLAACFRVTRRLLQSHSPPASESESTEPTEPPPPYEDLAGILGLLLCLKMSAERDLPALTS